MKTGIISLYKKARQYNRGTLEALRALELARKDFSNGKSSFVQEWPWQRGHYNVTRQEKRHASDNYVWIENTDSAGLRFAGFADEILHLRNSGYCTGEYGEDVYRGAVWQLPARKGVARYIAGYKDPNNDGAAFVDLDVVSETKESLNLWRGQKIHSFPQEQANDEAKHDAALRADSIAQNNAERAREYNKQWQAGARWADMADQISTMRQETLQLLAEMKVERKARGATAPTICATLRAAINHALRDISKLKKARAELFDAYGDTDGFADHSPRA